MMIRSMNDDSFDPPGLIYWTQVYLRSSTPDTTDFLTTFHIQNPLWGGRANVHHTFHMKSMQNINVCFGSGNTYDDDVNKWWWFWLTWPFFMMIWLTWPSPTVAIFHPCLRQRLAAEDIITSIIFAIIIIIIITVSKATNFRLFKIFPKLKCMKNIVDSVCVTQSCFS